MLLKDVAGLVPGACEGRGRGNKFLNDLLDADVLIHVIDMSGKTDENGKPTIGNECDTPENFLLKYTLEPPNAIISC